ncbi:hypothetical protein AB205_0221580 [Aquarana catesbeiana]|uniref:MAM domain-containing protein n=1 Tax=Aquarana catesbeiana TaxID=8400 RepID=A0A2G9RLI4_AQUCT|nr:hypothetical protein AB205_0221580 [Aquarana catesbeiana]
MSVPANAGLRKDIGRLSFSLSNIKADNNLCLAFTYQLTGDKIGKLRVFVNESKNPAWEEYKSRDERWRIAKIEIPKTYNRTTQTREPDFIPGDRKHPLDLGVQKGSEITHYFLRQHAASSPATPAKMAPPRVPPTNAAASAKKSAQPGTNAGGDRPASDDRSASPILSPVILITDTQSSCSHTRETGGNMEGSLRDILSGLPTRQDLQEMAASIVNALSRELHDLRQQVDTVDERVTVLESSASTSDARIAAMEQEQRGFRRHLVDIQLKLDDGENRSRRNNLRLRGIPEATMGSDLRATVVAILNQVLGKPPAAELELDRVHRIPGPRIPPAASQDPDATDLPRDVLCRVHFFTIKEEIMRLAWERGPIDFDGALIRIYPDISRQTRAMRGLMRPLLEVIRAAEATYRWGHPFHLIVRRQGAEFYLRSPDQLPDLFSFLAKPPITFEAERGKGKAGEIALDNVFLVTSPCPED